MDVWSGREVYCLSSVDVSGVIRGVGMRQVAPCMGLLKKWILLGGFESQLLGKVILILVIISVTIISIPKIRHLFLRV